jgi:integrase
MRLFNLPIRVRHDKTGNFLVLPGLVDSDCTIVTPLLRYEQHLLRRGLSQSHLQKVREAVRMFVEYSAANRPAPHFGQGQTGRIQEVSHWVHFRNFRHAVIVGSFGPEGFDPSGLNWAASGVDKADRVTTLLTDFFVWLDELDGGNRASRYNPFVTPTAYESMCAAAAYEYKRSEALLGHTWAQSNEVVAAHRALTGKLKKSALKDVKRIADTEFFQLLSNGFDASTEVGLRDSMITIMMNRAGVRPSEALAVWVIDVTNDPADRGSAYIKLWHPIEAKCRLTHKGRTYARRLDYLQGVYGLRDRISVPRSDPQHLGWKSRFDVLELYWDEPWWGKVFWRLYVAYLQMTAIKRLKHPYLFIESETGEPLSYDTFAKSYERGVYRAGLVPPGEWSLKDSGLTPHGNRHAYGDRIKNVYQCNEKVVQNALHHTSALSQIIYTVPSHRETQEMIRDAAVRMRMQQDELNALKQSLSKVRRELSDKAQERAQQNGMEPLPELLQKLGISQTE